VKMKMVILSEGSFGLRAFRAGQSFFRNGAR